MLTTKTENLREHIAFRETDFFRIDPGARHHRVDQILLIFAVHDGEAAGVTERAAVPAQHPIADRVKCAAPNPAGIDRQQIRDAIEHLPRGLVREREQQNISRIDSVLEQIRDAISERARFSRARAGDDEQRPGRRRHSRELLLIQLRRVIDVDRCRSWRALQRVLAGHHFTCSGGQSPSQIASLAQRTRHAATNRSGRDRRARSAHSRRPRISKEKHILRLAFADERLSGKPINFTQSHRHRLSPAAESWPRMPKQFRVRPAAR